MGDRSPREVVEHHLRAVARGNPSEIADDYAEDTVLDRPGQTLRGRATLEAYFECVPGRLAGRRLEQHIESVDGATVRVRWRIADGPSGSDLYVVEDGRILRQEVTLDADDF